METANKKIFTITDPRQERIYKRLLEIGSVPAAFFKDACRMMEEEQPMESKTNLVAHCLREVMGSVIDLLVPVNFAAEEEEAEKEKNDVKTEEILTANNIDPTSRVAKLIAFAVAQKNQSNINGHKKKVEAILVAYDIDPASDIAQLWLRTTDKQDDIAIYHFVHRNNLGLPASRGNSFKDLWESILVVLDAVLNKMEGKYLGFFKILDELIAVTTITKREVKILKEKVPNSPVAYNYFFEKLVNPDWLVPLAKAGFFKTPLPPIIYPDGGVAYPFWSQGIYLKKMATIQEKQQEVLEVCLAVDTDNTRAVHDLLEIALLLPVEMSAQIAAKIDEIDNFLSPQTYGKLIKYLGLNGKTREAVTLAEKVLAVQPDPRPTPEYDGYKFPHDPIAKIRDHDYEEILKKDYPDFIDAAGMEAIRVLFNKLEDYIHLSDTNRESGSKDDYSEIWRSAIEDHSQNHKFGVRDILVTAIRDACESFISKHPGQIDALLTELESRGLQIFRRIELHLLRLFPNGSEGKITDILMNNKEFGDKDRLTHEYFLLAEAHASLLSPAQRKVLWSWIEKGITVDMEAYKKRCKERGVEPSDAEVAKYKKKWQAYHLLPFKSIDPAWEKFYNELISEVGELKFPSFRSWSGEPTWGHKSIISEDEFKTKLPEEIVAYLKDWQPLAERDPLESTREGTSRILTAQIAEDPGKWTESLPSFIDLDSTFVRAVFAGHRDALRQNKIFDWKPLLELGKEVLKKPIAIPDRKPSGFFGDDPDWSWSRNMIAGVILEGLRNNLSGKIPQELKEDIWAIIATVMQDDDPTAEEEAERLKDNDPLSVAINTTRGVALETAIQYGIWVKEPLPEKKKKEWTLEKNLPELFKLLNDHLDLSIDPSVAIRAIYGEKLGSIAWQDEKWVEDNAEKIFPAAPNKQKYFDAAWDAFISFNVPYYGFLRILETQYARAIKELGSHTEKGHHIEDPEQNLAHHLILFYAGGKIPLETGLLKDFYEIAPLELRKAVIDIIGRDAKQRQMTEEQRDRLVALAEKRIDDIKNGANPEAEIQEFSEFSWWIYSEKFEDEWSLKILNQALKLGCDIEGDHLIVERYETLASKFSLEVITSTELMVLNDKNGWGVLSWGDKLRSVIETVLASNNDDAVEKAKEFIHRLVAKGYPQYKDLLPKQENEEK